uniref:Uncharacterized protein n=1 Tax=Solanum tuberosum TaxID=4113 RepID=M1DHE1_SOLTU
MKSSVYPTPKRDVLTFQGIWSEEQSKDTNRQKGTKQTEEVENNEPNDHQEHLTNHRVAIQFAKSSDVPALREEKESMTEKWQSLSH